MTPDELYGKFWTLANPFCDHVVSWKGVNKNSIVITLDFGEEFIFTYHSYNNWRLETKASYIRAKLRECDCYI